MSAQERLLRAVEYGEITRIGASRPVRVDVRIVAATNEDLPKAAEEGRFRADLLDRLSFEVITLPRCACARAISRFWPITSDGAWPPSCTGIPGPALPPRGAAAGRLCVARKRPRVT
jgi:hypothetical protein